MRLVAQETPNSCGQACVAMVAGVTWAQAVAAVGIAGITQTRDLRRGLERLGIPSGETVRLRKGAEIPDRAIVMLRTKGQRVGHWVVWFHQYFWDPGACMRLRSDDLPELQKPTSYIPIGSPSQGERTDTP